MTKADPDLYDFLPYRDRPKIRWPNGARIAVWIAPNIEFYEFEPAANPALPGWPRPAPDIDGYSLRDYGNRVGVWRMIEVMAKHDVRGSVSLNVAICDHHPEIIEACNKLGWEFFSHGVYNTRFTYGMSEAQESALIRDVIDTVRKHTGQKLDGWLAPALSNTERTMDLLARHDITYTCDLFHDDQPTPVKVREGKLISIPYSLEMNDVIVYARQMASPREYGDMIRAQFDQLYAEGEESGTVMCVPLHPYLVGAPHRLAPFVQALAYMRGHDRVWFATGREIAHWFRDHYCDAFAAAIAAQAR